MISFLAYSPDEQELKRIKTETRELAATLTEDDWNYQLCKDLAKLNDLAQSESIMDLACCDVVKEGSADHMAKLREKFSQMLLLLMADMSVSPLTYVRPDIMATSLILRPYTEKDLREKLREIILKYAQSVENESDHSFYIDGQDGKIRIPYDSICYFESRNKKIFIRLANREIPFYGTLEELEGELPEEFLRCHRSFIVNKKYIDKIQISKNIILLTNDMDVPLSRSYKAVFKAI